MDRSFSLRTEHMRSALGFALLLTLCGCGYTAGSLLRQDIQTVHIPVFDNLSFRRGLELDLTRALKAEVRTRTHLRQVGEAEAESVLTGKIIEVEERVISEDEDDRVTEERITVTVLVEWRRANGEQLAFLPRVRASADVARGRGEKAAVGERQALARLAQRIVQLLEDRSW